MILGKRINLFLIFIMIFSLCAFLPAQPLSENSDSAARQGYEAFRNEDWNSAAVFLRKAVSLPADATDENYLMLIKSEIYSGEYKMAQEDCTRFLDKFPLSVYASFVQYQNGRLLHLLGKNDDAVIALSDFCKQHYDDELYPLALFWIAEAFYDEYNFDTAKGLYERLVNDFPNSAKAKDAQYKLDLIAQRAREEKLLYLLKVIGEENLSTREEYERQLKVYQLGDKGGYSSEIAALQARIKELEDELAKKPVETVVVPKSEVPVEKTAVEVQKPVETQKTAPVAPSAPKATGSVQTVNEPSLHLRKKPSRQDSENLKRKTEQIPYMIENQSTDGEK